MRVAIVTAVYAPMINGVAVFAANLARGLAARGHEVLVVTPEQGRDSEKKGDDLANGGANANKVTVRRTKSLELKVYPDQVHQAERGLLGLYRHGLRASVAPGREVARILAEFDPEVVHVQTMEPLGKAAAKWARKHQVALVSTEHNQPEVLVESLKLPRMISKTAEKWLGRYLIRQQGRSDFVTMPTEEAIYNLVVAPGRILRPPVAAISNGVDFTRFQPGKPPAEFYRRYNLPQGVPVVLYVGRVDPEKQVERVLAAFARMVRGSSKVSSAVNDAISRDSVQNGENLQVKNVAKTAHLVVVGDGVALSALKKQAKRLGVGARVHFAGRVVGEDLTKMYQLGTVFTTASEVETQGIVLIEAAATGLPLVAVDAGAVKEVCRDGENGILCQPGDVTGMAEALARILDDAWLRRQMSQKSQKIAQGHSLEATLEQFENVYKKAIKLARAPVKGARRACHTQSE